MVSGCVVFWAYRDCRAQGSLGIDVMGLHQRDFQLSDIWIPLKPIGHKLKSLNPSINTS